MTEDNKLLVCKQLYEEYKSLSDKAIIIAEKNQSVPIPDILKKEELRKKLLEGCRAYLEKEITPTELFDMENS